ncbi:MAG TPA: prephenate dehydrogenase/arogenate dehydrogenase family protein [Candidatus Acidoferrales bacterium]|nr:prephenate dehydrogenase/arogenate dehydrogenase family protein [Candidatus Acidoferrales bacterium]
MASSVPFRRVAIVGTGLIGGSFALALRRRFPDISLAGFDRPTTAEKALARGVVDETASDLATVVRGADLVYVALPIAAAMEAFPAIAAAVAPNALITDACSTKIVVCRAANESFCNGARFLGGHPMAGKERSGIEAADDELFRGAPYALIGSELDLEGESSTHVKAFTELLIAIGAQPVWCDPDTHDWAVGIVSHLPQLVSLALARVVRDETDETGLPLSLAGSGLQDTLRLAGSPYEVWRDIFLTNTDNIARALDRLTQAIDYLRTRLTSREIKNEFETANDLYKRIRREPDNQRL